MPWENVYNVKINFKEQWDSALKTTGPGNFFDGRSLITL